MSDEMYVIGLSFITHSISVSMVLKPSDLPMTFLRIIFVNPIKLSHHPPYQGGAFRINFQFT